MFLDDIDFATMYIRHKSTTNFKGKSSQDWDEKSSSMASRMIKSDYVEEFISKMDIDLDDVVLDIGCGPGTLAIPLAKMAKKVIAIDFSEGMLSELKKYAKEEGVDNIETHLLSWEDDWSEFEDVDIAVASRSVEVKDIEEALTKVSQKVKKSVYMTYKVGGSFVDMEILDYIGKKIVTKPDFWYIPILLYNMGYYPKIDYIKAPQNVNNYKNADEFIESLVWSVHHLDDSQIKKARQYFNEHSDSTKINQKAYDWAYISYKVSK